MSRLNGRWWRITVIAIAGYLVACSISREEAPPGDGGMAVAPPRSTGSNDTGDSGRKKESNVSHFEDSGISQLAIPDGRNRGCRGGPDSPDPLESDQVAVFFVCQPRHGPVDVAATVRRVGSSGDPQRAAMALLLAGPTAQERKAGFRTQLGGPKDGVTFDLTRRKSSVKVNLSRQALDLPALLVTPFPTRQIVSTMRQFESVRRVELYIAGKPLCSYDPECSVP